MIVNTSKLMKAMTQSVTKMTVVVALLTGAAVPAVSAAAATTVPTSGTVQFLSTQSGHQRTYDIVTRHVSY